MLAEGRGKQHVCMGKRANRMLVERESTCKWDVSRGGGENRLLVEGVGPTGC